MIEKPYFVILNHPNGHYMPMVDINENLVMFDSEMAAIVAGNKNMLGFGFEVFELGGGVYIFN
jgi:hypothetical protein